MIVLNMRRNCERFNTQMSMHFIVRVEYRTRLPPHPSYLRTLFILSGQLVIWYSGFRHHHVSAACLGPIWLHPCTLFWPELRDMDFSMSPAARNNGNANRAKHAFITRALNIWNTWPVGERGCRLSKSSYLSDHW